MVLVEGVSDACAGVVPAGMLYLSAPTLCSYSYMWIGGCSRFETVGY